VLPGKSLRQPGGACVQICIGTPDLRSKNCSSAVPHAARGMLNWAVRWKTVEVAGWQAIKRV